MFLFFSALFADIIGAVTGFGASTVFLPLALFVLDFRPALVLVAISHIFSNLWRLVFFRAGLDKKLIIYFGIPSVLLTLVGAMLVAFVPQQLLRFSLGIFLTLFSIIFLLKSKLRLPADKSIHVIGGGLSGFLAGIIGTGGTVRGAFLTGLKLDKKSYIANSAVIALLVDMTRLPIYIQGGFFTSDLYIYLPFLFIAAIIGSYVGKIILAKVPQPVFRKVVLVAIALVGIKFIIEGPF